MADKAHRLTDEKLEEMERRLSAIYSQAEKELEKTAAEYFKKFEELDAKKAKDVAEGKITPEEYREWRKGKIMYGKRYTAMKEQIARQLLEVNQTAVAYINGELPEIYALNYNALSRDVDGLGGYSFTLTDANTVRLLSTTDKSLLPYKEIDPAKDIPWNMKKINSEVLQGILQGDSIPKISGRIRNVQEMNKAAAVRSARTIVTGAENKGRMDSFERAAKDGIILKKEWVATSGPRTRDWHADLNGVQKEIDEPFENVIRLSKHKKQPDKIMFPGDPHAHPANVYNCRCTLISKVVGFSNKVKETTNFSEMSVPEYEKWQKENSAKALEIQEMKAEFEKKYGIDFDAARKSRLTLKVQEEGYKYGKFAEDAASDFETSFLRDFSLSEIREWGESHLSYIASADGSRIINSFLRAGRSIKPIEDEYRRLGFKGKKLKEIIDRYEKEAKETISAMERIISRHTISENIVVDRWAGIDAIQKMGIDIGDISKMSKGRIGHAFVHDGIDYEKIRKNIESENIGSVLQDDGFMSASAQSDLNIFRGSDVKFTIKVPKGTHAYVTDNVDESEIIFAPGTQQEIEAVNVIETEAVDHEGKKVKRKAIEIVLKIIS